MMSDENKDTDKKSTNAVSPSSADTSSAKSEIATETLAGKTNNDSDKDSNKNSDKSLTSSKNQKPAAKSKEKAKTKHTSTPSSRKFPLVASIMAVLILATGGASYWLYQQNAGYKQQIAAQASKQQSLTEQLTQLQSQLSKVGEQQQSLVARAEQTEEKGNHLTVSVEQVNDQVKALASAKGKDPLKWRIAEVEYLLSVANHRLSLDRDVATTMVVLNDADKRLRAIGDPAFIPVRELISKELGALNAVDLPDVPGIAAKLKNLKDSVGELPFVKHELKYSPQRSSTESQSAEESSEQEQSLVARIWNDIVTGLFRVQRSDQPIQPLLPPDEKQFLVQNLVLKLEQARNALLQGNTGVYQDNLQDINQALQSYFNTEDAAVTAALTSVGELTQVDLKPALPDISASLRELRNWIQQQQLALRPPHQYPGQEKTQAAASQPTSIAMEANTP